VKGGDYKGKAVVGQDIANELKLVQFVDGVPHAPLRKSKRATKREIKHAIYY